MKITRVSLWSVPLKSHKDYHMAGGKSWGFQDGARTARFRITFPPMQGALHPPLSI